MSAPAFALGSTCWPGLAKLAEEAGEVGQVCGKLIAVGGAPTHHDGTDLVGALHDELGDLLAAVEFMAEQGLIREEVLLRRAETKLARLRGWHAAQRTDPLTRSAS